MAGLGFDAAIMADVQEGMKDRLGWLAYVAAGARNLRGPQMKVSLRYDEQPRRSPAGSAPCWPATSAGSAVASR